MARPKPVMPGSVEVERLIDTDGRLAVRVTPGARSESVEIEGWRLQVKTRARPQDGAANAAVVRLVAAALGCAPSRINLIKGSTSRDKVLKVDR